VPRAPCQPPWPNRSPPQEQKWQPRAASWPYPKVSKIELRYRNPNPTQPILANGNGVCGFKATEMTFGANVGSGMRNNPSEQMFSALPQRATSVLDLKRKLPPTEAACFGPNRGW